MRHSLLIILVLGGIYITWVQKITRDHITATAARERVLRQSLRDSETALAAARRELEVLKKGPRPSLSLCFAAGKPPLHRPVEKKRG